MNVRAYNWEPIVEVPLDRCQLRVELILLVFVTRHSL